VQNSSTNLQTLDSQQHLQQQPPQAAPGAACVTAHHSSPTEKRQGQGWPANAPPQQGRSPAQQQPAQQLQQQRGSPAKQQQGVPAKQQQQQARQTPMLQQQSAAVLPVQPKKSQNHMFWDVAPRTINPSQVCECRQQSDSMSILHAAAQSKTGPDKEIYQQRAQAAK
jgi:hypothetical protein